MLEHVDEQDSPEQAVERESLLHIRGGEGALWEAFPSHIDGVLGEVGAVERIVPAKAVEKITVAATYVEQGVVRRVGSCTRVDQQFDPTVARAVGPGLPGCVAV